MNSLEDNNPTQGFGAIPAKAVDLAQKHVTDILQFAVEYSASSAAALVVYDRQCDLAQAITKAYRSSLPKAAFVDFDTVSADSVRAEFAKLQPASLVVLIQSTNFRLDDFRIRVDLFNRSIKVIEHPHLSRMLGGEPLYYIDALAYDPDYFRGVGGALKARIDAASSGVIDSGGAQLRYPAGFEPVALNVGDYREMRNVGGLFPIGEVFTESKELEAVSGRLRIFAFGDTGFRVSRPPKPITLVVSEGRLQETLDSTSEFEEVLANIRRDEGGEVWVRELGFGLNRAFTKQRVVSDVGTFERMFGIHLSLGAKHNFYKKPDFKYTRRTARHHCDVFADTQAVLLDGENVYREEGWCV